MSFSDWAAYVVHVPIRSDPDFIKNKILIIWYILNIISNRFGKLSKLSA